MLNKCKWVLILLAVLLAAAAAQADIITVNGGFEDDAGGTYSGLPTGWQFDNYDGYGVAPDLMDVSGIGGGAGGTVGLKFPNWDSDEGWRSAITQIVAPVEVGHYTFTVTFTGQGMDKADDNWLKGKVYSVSNPDHPWRNYDTLAMISSNNGWIELDGSDNEIWQTHSVDFDILNGDSHLGTFFAPWFEVKNYKGHIILGEISLVRTNAVPEPATMFLLGTGILGLLGFRKRFKR